VAEFVKVARTSDIPVGTLRKYDVRLNEFVIAHSANGFHAFADECTHDGAPFGDGRLDGHEIVCPRHGARFDIRTGKVTGPPALIPVEVYELKIEGDDILVRLD
jgi:3-phenylpropionate/trans-cinnamate dioxygenase ferredoxin subunit